MYEFGQQFAQYILSVFPSAKIVSGGREICTRCMYCGDSKDITHGHLYIHIPQDKDDAPTYHCFKCQVSGILNGKTLTEWGIYSPDIGIETDKVIKNATKNNKFKGYNSIRYPFYNHIYNTNLANQKLDYIYDRIGVRLSIEECMKQKIILNLKDVLDYPYNGINQYTRYPNIIQSLNDNFVGFLSLDNNFVNLRRICEEGILYKGIDKRYVVYNIHNKIENTEKMYVMPIILDLTKPERIQIHIAEGPFDILSIKYNLRYNDNGIFAAITGSGYLGFIMHLIINYEIFYFDLHIYPDNDENGSDYKMKQIKDFITPYGANLYIHRNTMIGEKDFGVKKDRINEVIYNFN